MKTAIEKLDQWFQKEKRENGLLDLKIYRGSRADLTIEGVAAEVLKSVKAGDKDCVDITHEPL